MKRVYWSDEHIQALKRLADLSCVYNKAGNLESRKDWKLGLSKLETQDPVAYKLLSSLGRLMGRDNLKTNENIAYLTHSWRMYEMRAHGLCRTKDCTGAVVPETNFCKTCLESRIKIMHSGRGVYSSANVRKNIQLAEKIIDEMSEAQIKLIIKEHIDTLPYAIKRLILGGNFGSRIIMFNTTPPLRKKSKK